MSVGRFLQQAAAGAGAGGATGDDDFANVVLLLDGDGTSGDANNTFTDSGSLGGTVTESGSVVQGSFSPYGDNWSNYFGGNSGLNFGDVTAVDFNANDWTIELWWNPQDLSNGDPFVFKDNVATRSFQFRHQPGTSGELQFGFWSNNVLFLATATSEFVYSAGFNVGEWYHIALVHDSGTFECFVNGTSIGAWTPGANNIDSGTDTLNVGYYSGGSPIYASGYLSNVRVVNGTALYTSSFTPSTSPLTAVTNTTLLTCQSNRFKDNSSNDYSVTLAGSPKVTPFSPFKDDDARDITTDGGSANFNQNDLLTIADNSALDVSGAMTAEAWIYVNDFPDGNVGATGQGFVITRWVASGSQRSWGIFLGNNGQTSFYVSNTGGASYTISSSATGAIGQHQWHHIAISWDGSNQRLFIDGDLKATTANTSGPFSTASAPFCANALNTNLTGSNMDMYIADARYFTNKCLYTASFAVPTAPLGNLTGTANTLNYVEYENKSFSVNSQETSPQGVRFKSDGTKMYVVGNTGNDVMQYSLSTAWDVSTASFDSVTLSVDSQDGTPNGLAFSSDGTKLYITGNINNRIFQYDLSTAWDLSTASYANKSLLTSTAAGTGPIEPFMRSNGTDFYYLDNDDDTVYQYTLSTANDISTASYASKSFSVASQETTPTGLAFSSDGTKMFVCGQAGDDINQYTLSTAWDVSTASFDNIRFAVNTQATNPSGIDLKPDGTKLYMISNVSPDAVYQYSLTPSVSPTVLLNFQDAGIYDRSGINNLDTVGNAQIDTAVKKYGTGSIEFDGTGDYLEAVYPSGLYDGFNDMDWTIEAWVYPKADSDDRGGIVELYTSDTHYIRLMYVPGSTSGNVDFQFAGNGFDIQSGNFSELAWYHVAGVSYNGTVTLYVDGTAIGSDSAYNASSIIDPRVVIGLDLVSTDRYTDGFIDDVRITKGVARYTANFTPPTDALPKF